MDGIPNYSRARAVAENQLRINHVLRPPVSPREIAENNGLKVEFITLDRADRDVAGFIDFEDSTIFVNQEDHYNRQTFTIAHELGHFLLHKDYFDKEPEQYQVLLRRPIGAEISFLEKEANAFAADLLVPRSFLDFYGKYADEDDLATLFAVSREVIGYRLTYAGKKKTF